MLHYNHSAMEVAASDIDTDNLHHSTDGEEANPPFIQSENNLA